MEMPKINKEYIQDAQKFEEFKETLLEQKRDEYLTENLLLEPYHVKFKSTPKSKERHQNKFILSSEPSQKVWYTSLKSGKQLKIKKKIELIEPFLELEIRRASLKFAQLRQESERIDISEEIWNYTKGFIKDISDKYWNKFGRHLPRLKIEFIDESIEFRWIKNNSRLVLSFTDYFDDIIVYVKISKGQYFSESVSRSEIEDWVFFWLNRI